MDFFYHPILGLQYTCTYLFLVDLDKIPEVTMSWQEAMALLSEKGVECVNSDHSLYEDTTVISSITSNVQ